MNTSIDYYLSLPYTIELTPDDDSWFVAVKELPGCMSQGDTIEEAVEMIHDAMRGWIEVSLEDGDLIPVPMTLENRKKRLTEEAWLYKRMNKCNVEFKKIICEGTLVNPYDK